MILDGTESPQKLVSRINAPLSRQPLVKGERLVRYDLSAAMTKLIRMSSKNFFSDPD